MSHPSLILGTLSLTPPDLMDDVTPLAGDYYKCDHCGLYYFEGEDGSREVSPDELYPENWAELVHFGDKCDDCFRAEAEEDYWNRLSEQQLRMKKAFDIIELMKKAARKIDRNQEYINQSLDWRHYNTFPVLVAKARREVDITTRALKRIENKYQSIIMEVSNAS